MANDRRKEIIGQVLDKLVHNMSDVSDLEHSNTVVSSIKNSDSSLVKVRWTGKKLWIFNTETKAEVIVSYFDSVDIALFFNDSDGNSQAKCQKISYAQAVKLLGEEIGFDE